MASIGFEFVIAASIETYFSGVLKGIEYGKVIRTILRKQGFDSESNFGEVFHG